LALIALCDQKLLQEKVEEVELGYGKWEMENGKGKRDGKGNRRE